MLTILAIIAAIVLDMFISQSRPGSERTRILERFYRGQDSYRNDR